MKSYYDFMLFITVSSLLKGINWAIQKLKDQKKIAGSLSDPAKEAEVLRNPKK